MFKYCDDPHPDLALETLCFDYFGDYNNYKPIRSAINNYIQVVLPKHDMNAPLKHILIRYEKKYTSVLSHLRESIETGLSNACSLIYMFVPAFLPII